MKNNQIEYLGGKCDHDIKTQDWDLSFQLWWDSLLAQMVKHLLAMWETGVRSLAQEGPLEKEIATHSSILGWKIPWMEKPGGLQFMRSQRVGHNWATNTHFQLWWSKFIYRTKSPTFNSCTENTAKFKQCKVWVSFLKQLSEDIRDQSRWTKVGSTWGART